MRVCRILVMTMAWLLFVSQEGRAFKGVEHRNLSVAALEIALRAAGDDPSFSEVRQALLGCAEQDDDEPCFDFGRVTRAVDFVFHPDYLVPSFECFLDPSARPEIIVGIEPRCRRSIRPCSKVEEAMQDAEHLDQAFLDYVEERVTDKSRDVWGRLMAVHRNIDHFEACAVENYTRFHAEALDRAKTQSLVSALLTEAVALHFLQDAFPPGHLLTPRALSSDLLARGLHNRHNEEGLAARADLSHFDELRLAFLDLSEQGHPSLDWASGCRGRGLNAMDSRLSLPFGLKGDGALLRLAEDLCDPLDPDCEDSASTCDQLVSLLVTSAASILEVVMASRHEPTRDPLQLCFEPWTGLGSPDAVDRDSYTRPRLALRLGHYDSAPEVLVSPIEPTPGEIDRWSLRPELTASVVFDSAGSEGQRLEASLIGGFPADDDIALRGSTSASDFAEKRRSLHGFLVGGNLSFEEWASYESVGFHLYAYPYLNRHGDVHVNTFFGLGLGARRYLAPEFESDRFTWGIRGGVGLGVLFLEGGVEDAYRLVAPDRLEGTVVWSLGIRWQLVW